MSIHAYSGAAGCGKTYSVFEQLKIELLGNPLKNYQRVLAITFMHGARYRLIDQLSKIEELKRRYDASTLDSLAWTICRRWTSRIIEMGMQVPVISAFDEIIKIAVKLLSFDDVRSWITTVYPIIVVDEAQDLETDRLQIIEELMKSSCVLLAYDEFQCLNIKNRPVAITSWHTGKFTPTDLLKNKRTNNPHLLQAALQVRSAENITVDHATFKIKIAPQRANAKPSLAATIIAYQLLKNGTFAILTPTIDSSSYFKSIMEMLQTESIGTTKMGPFNIKLENTTNKLNKDIQKVFEKEEKYTFSEIKDSLEPYKKWPVIDLVLKAIKRLLAVQGKNNLLGDRVLEIFDRQSTTYKQHIRPRDSSKMAMTIHQAKNREFDNVIIIWPFQIPTDKDYRRRMLYNAITRAKKTCLIVVQSDSLTKESPFIGTVI